MIREKLMGCYDKEILPGISEQNGVLHCLSKTEAATLLEKAAGKAFSIDVLDTMIGLTSDSSYLLVQPVGQREDRVWDDNYCTGALLFSYFCGGEIKYEVCILSQVIGFKQFEAFVKELVSVSEPYDKC